MDAQARTEALAELGLAAEGSSLAAAPRVPLAPEGVDPRTMPVAAIVFDPRLLDGFNLTTDVSDASRSVFAHYKSHGRDKDRNGLLHRRVSEFIGQVKRERTGDKPTHVRDKVRASKPTRDLAMVLDEFGVTADELRALLEGLRTGGE